MKIENKCENCEHYYNAEAKVKLICFDSIPPEIKAGQAVAQATIIRTPRQIFQVVEKLSKPVEKHLGFGSTTNKEIK